MKRRVRPFTLVEIFVVLFFVALFGSVIAGKGVGYYRFYRTNELEQQKRSRERYYQQLSRIEGEPIQPENGDMPACYLLPDIKTPS